jgi:mono/diheme cytochrome c family protein
VHVTWLVLALVVAACDRSASSPSVAAPVDAPLTISSSASKLVEKFQCTRCHDVPGSEPAVRDKHCVRCHQQIHAGTFTLDQGTLSPETLDRWRTHIQSLRSAPSLVAASRLRRAWVTGFLLRPYDVRPGSVAQMPRLALTDAEAAQLATALVPVETLTTIEPSPAEVARGEQLFGQLACGRCHRFTGATVDDPARHAAGQLTDQLRRTGGEVEQQAIAWTLAPDLRFARERVQPGQLAAWIERPGGAMPVIAGVGPREASALAAYIATTPLAAIATPEVPARLPVLAREVTYAEVSAAVFRATCWHCHAVPDFARGDGGPGNSGGFGFAPRGLDLSSYTGISEGSFDDTGERRSIFAKLPDGTPRVVAHLMARHVEAAGGSVDGVRGMPLGLPPLSLAQIQLVESWVAQGRPQ